MFKKFFNYMNLILFTSIKEMDIITVIPVALFRITLLATGGIIILSSKMKEIVKCIAFISESILGIILVSHWQEEIIMYDIDVHDVTDAERNSALVTGIACETIAGLGVSYLMVRNHKTIIDGIKIIGNCIKMFF